MTYDEFYRLARKEGIPIADIRVVFDGYFHVPFDRIGIDGDKIAPLAEKALEKLKIGYPANYLAGYIDILSTHILLNESTLIPRNETADFLHQYLLEKDLNHKRILDLCTGSGFIAIAIKKRYPEASVFASDISVDALKIAKHSAEINHADIQFLTSDFLEDINGKFDIIISNPPYIEEGSKNMYAPYEPELALYSGKDGMDSYRKIFGKLFDHLNPNGEAYFELESTNSLPVKKLFDENKKNPHYTSKIWKDSYGRDRYLLIQLA